MEVVHAIRKLSFVYICDEIFKVVDDWKMRVKKVSVFPRMVLMVWYVCEMYFAWFLDGFGLGKRGVGLRMAKVNVIYDGFLRMW